MDTVGHGIQNYIISEESVPGTRLIKRANECMPNVSDDKKLNNESKDVNENDWFNPQKCMPTKNFLHVKIKKIERRGIIRMLHW